MNLITSGIVDGIIVIRFLIARVSPVSGRALFADLGTSICPSASLVFDLGSIVCLDAPALSLLLRCIRRAEQVGASLKICNLQEKARVVAEMSGLNQIVDIYNSESEARRAVAAEPAGRKSVAVGSAAREETVKHWMARAAGGGKGVNKARLLSELSRRYPASWTATRLSAAMAFWRHWIPWFANSRSYEWLKRTLDFGAALVSLVVLLPIMLLIAIAIKLTDRGPAIYNQWRVGKNGRLFPCPKFRSMVVDADQKLDELRACNHHGESTTFKMKRDPRVTRVGRLLRRTSLDELPQLWCVLLGYMSLVGPRPAPPYEVSRYSMRARKRLAVRPGITCIWQVSGRGDIPFERQVEMDIEYIEQQTLRTDLALLIRTIPAVVAGKGAY